jgi:transcriptional regulator with XRE-family HTH domain
MKMRGDIMKVDSKRIREERVRRAWSQEHVAVISGLSLRTIQRIENTGGASNESIAALASVLAIPVEQLILASDFKKSLAELLVAKRLWVLVVAYVVATIVTPPQAAASLAVLGGVWIVFELIVATVLWKNIQI